MNCSILAKDFINNSHISIKITDFCCGGCCQWNKKAEPWSKRDLPGGARGATKRKELFLRIWIKVFSCHLCSSEYKFCFFQIQGKYSGIGGLRDFCEEEHFLGGAGEKSHGWDKRRGENQGWVTLGSQSLDGFMSVKVKLSSTQVFPPWAALGMAGSARSPAGMAEWAQLHSAIWAGHGVTSLAGPNGGTESCPLFDSLLSQNISTSQTRTQPAVAAWHGKMDTDCSLTGLQP